MIRILIVDSQAEVRRGLHMLLAVQPDLVVVGEAGELAEALALIDALDPDVIVADIGTESGGGPEVVASLRGAAPGAILIALALHADQAMRARARDAGAQTFMEKCDGALGLLQTLREIAHRQPPESNL